MSNPHRLLVVVALVVCQCTEGPRPINDQGLGERRADSRLTFIDGSVPDDACPDCCDGVRCQDGEKCSPEGTCRKICLDQPGCGTGHCCGGLCYDEACVDTLAGSGLRGAPDAPFEQARINGVYGMALDLEGNLLFSEWPSSGIRIVNTGTRTINGVPPNWVGRLIGHGLGCRAGDVQTAEMGVPTSIAVAPDGTVYVADYSCAVVWKVTLDYQRVELVAGAPGEPGHQDGLGGAARLSQPRGLAVGPGGDVYVTDWGTDVIRRITTGGDVSTVAGIPGEFDEVDGPAAVAKFHNPGGIAVDSEGTLYVGDYSGGALRRITGAQSPGGAVVETIVTTLAKGEDACGAAAWQAIPDNAMSPSYPSYTTLGLVDGPKLYVPFWTKGIYEVVQLPDETWEATLFTPATGSIGLAVGQGSLWTGGWVNASREEHTIGQMQLSDKTLVRTIGLAGHGGITDGAAAAATLDTGGCWSSVAADDKGNVWFTDACRHLVRKVTPQGRVESIGSGAYGVLAGSASEAGFCYPTSLTVVGESVFVVNRSCGFNVMRIDANTGDVEVRASICVPDKPCARPTPSGGMVADGDGNLYVSVHWASGAGTSDLYGKSCNNTMPMIVKIPQLAKEGAVPAYFAGTENNANDPEEHAKCIDGVLGTGQFSGGVSSEGPSGLAIDAAGNLYVADGLCGVRKVDPSGTISTLDSEVPARGIALVTEDGKPDQLYTTTDHQTIWSLSIAGGTAIRVAGDPATGHADHYRDGAAGQARFWGPGAAATDASGTVYVVDRNNARIRVLYPK